MTEKTHYAIAVEMYDKDMLIQTKKDIKEGVLKLLSIVTKQQFNSMKYIVGGKEE